MCVYVCVFRTHSSAFDVQKRVLVPLELQLLVALSHPLWVLGTEL